MLKLMREARLEGSYKSVNMWTYRPGPLPQSRTTSPPPVGIQSGGWLQTVLEDDIFFYNSELDLSLRGGGVCRVELAGPSQQPPDLSGPTLFPPLSSC